MPKYWVKNYFAHGRFPEVGQKQKTEEKEEREKQWPSYAWRTQARLAHASRLSQNYTGHYISFHSAFSINISFKTLNPLIFPLVLPVLFK